MILHPHFSFFAKAAQRVLEDTQVSPPAKNTGPFTEAFFFPLMKLFYFGTKSSAGLIAQNLKMLILRCQIVASICIIDFECENFGCSKLVVTITNRLLEYYTNIIATGCNGVHLAESKVQLEQWDFLNKYA